MIVLFMISLLVLLVMFFKNCSEVEILVEIVVFEERMFVVVFF